MYIGLAVVVLILVVGHCWDVQRPQDTGSRAETNGPISPRPVYGGVIREMRQT